MKKKNLSFMTLFMLTASLVGGCSCNKQSNENVSNLVIKVGDKEYSANELYNELLSTGAGANEAFAKVLRLVVESSMDTTQNIQAAADLAAENFEKEVENDSITNGTSKDESREKLLEEKGYSSVEEMKADIIYEQKLTRVTETFWETRKSVYFEKYIEARLPYLIRHVLVKIDDTNANKIANNVAISQSDADKLFDVIKRFENGDKFSYIANQESEDTGSTATGGAYYMDNTSGVEGFVDEFVYGTYAFDAYTTKTVEAGVTTYTYGANASKVSKLTGLTDIENFSKYYENGFNFVDMSIVNMLGEVYNQTTLSNKDYFNIGVVNKVVDEASGDVTYESVSGNLNNSENAYARSIIFNRVFNKPGVSVIGYNSQTEIPESVKNNKNYVELKLSDTESKYILTDEKGHPIFFVAARGSSNQIWVHFLTINVSSLDDIDNAKKFFSINPDMEDDDTSYVELMNTAGTSQRANEIISELEGYVKSYVTYGSGGTIGEESILNYDLVEHYMGNSITYVSTELKTAIESYIANRRKFLETKLLNSMSDDWDTHTDKLISNMSGLVQMGVKPFECGVFVASDVDDIDNPYTALTTSDYLCRYVYGEGYQVQLSYYYKSGTSATSFTKISKSESNRAYFTDQSNYKQYVSIGGENSNHIILPTPEVATGYTFEGWYTDKELNNPVSQDIGGNYYIDLSESRMTNNTIFFADIRAIEATTINYIYRYKGTTVNVGDEILVTNNNVKSKVYSETDKTISLDLTKISSDYVNIVTTAGFKYGDGTAIENNQIVLELSNRGQTIDVVVEVEPVATDINYVFVDQSGNSVESADLPYDASIPTTAIYKADGEDAENTITLNIDKFAWASDSSKVATGFKVARNGVEFSEADSLDSPLVLNEKDMSKDITVYVIVGTTTGGQE